MKVKRNLLFIVFTLVVFFMFLPNKVSAITATELKQKLDDVRYHDSELRDGIQYTGEYYGSTCYAFANKVASKVFGSSHYTNRGAWQDYYNLDNLCIGDVIEYVEPTSSTGLHCFIVTNLDGDNIEVTDSNYVSPYMNKWAKGWTTKYDLRPDENNPTRLKVVWHFKDNNVKSFATDTEKPKIVDSGVDMTSITSTSFKIRVKATDNVGVTQVGLNIWAPNQDRVWRLANYNSSTGYWEYTIRKSDFSNASGLYDFDTYVFDAAGNSVSRAYSAFPMGSIVVTNLGNFTARIAMKGNTNYVMGTEGTASKSGAVLKTKSLSDSSQIWKFSKNSDNTYTITHVTSGHVLDIYNYSNENGAKVQIYPNANTDNQKFYIMSYNGGYRIVQKGSNDAKAVDNANGKIANGNKMDLYEAYTIDNVAQTWTFEKVATSISIAQASTSLKVGETRILNKTISPTGVATTAVKWTSSDASIVTVNSAGEITGKKAGTALVTATTTDGTNLTATSKVTVTQATQLVTSIKLDTTSISMKKGSNRTINATILPSNATNKTLSWSTSNSYVATVSNGVVTAKGDGMCTIIARTTDGTNITASCKVMVTSLPFDDVRVDEWYYDAVKYAYTNNIVSGTSSTTFSPNEKVTRGMLVTMLHKMEGTPYVAGTSKFSDMKDTKAYYYMAVKWATQNGIVSGYDNGTFGPNDNITREQLAVILNKYCRYKNKYQVQANILNQFKDTNKISNFAYWGMQWATGAKVITGSNGYLNPQGTATRAEVVSMLYKYGMNIK